jgi:hypothetical protein
MSRTPLGSALLLLACGGGDPPSTGGSTDLDTSGAPLTGTADATTATSTTATTESIAPTSTGDPLPDTTDATTSTTSTPSTTLPDPTTDTTGESTGDPPPPQDACVGRTPACPADMPGRTGGGLVEIDRCAFPLQDQGTWDAQAARVEALAAALPRIALGELPAAEFNRVAEPLDAVPGGVPDLVHAFRWNDEDNDSETWIPQGITGTPDGAGGPIDGRQLLLVSWYHDADPNKGSRVSAVDLTDPDAPRYRHILLVEPTGDDPVDFVPIPIHAGGLGWFGDYLYVPHTSKGFRVFDTRSLLQVDTSTEQIGLGDDGLYHGGLYKFVMPQVGAYFHASDCEPRFSSVSVDRTSDPPSLVSSEYCSGTNGYCDAALAGRIYRWPLDPTSGRLVTAPDVWPTAAWFMAQSHVQGGSAHDGDFYLSSSAPAGQAGALYVLPGGGPSQTATWVDTPEDLMQDGDLLWSLSEGTGIRTVFAVDRTALP